MKLVHVLTNVDSFGRSVHEMLCEHYCSIGYYVTDEAISCYYFTSIEKIRNLLSLYYYNNLKTLPDYPLFRELEADLDTIIHGYYDI